MVPQNCCSAWLVLGAKNSKEKDRLVFSRSVTRVEARRRTCCDVSGASGCRGFGGMCLSITQRSSFCAETTITSFAGSGLKQPSRKRERARRRLSLHLLGTLAASASTLGAQGQMASASGALGVESFWPGGTQGQIA